MKRWKKKEPNVIVDVEPHKKEVPQQITSLEIILFFIFVSSILQLRLAFLKSWATPSEYKEYEKSTSIWLLYLLVALCSGRFGYNISKRKYARPATQVTMALAISVGLAGLVSYGAAAYSILQISSVYSTLLTVGTVFALSSHVGLRIGNFNNFN